MSQQASPMMTTPSRMQSTTANDEVIAHALQEEFSNLASLEARKKEYKNLDASRDEFQEHLLTQEWTEVDTLSSQSKHDRDNGPGMHEPNHKELGRLDCHQPGAPLLAGHQTGSEFGSLCDFGLVTSQSVSQHPAAMGPRHESTSSGLQSNEDDDHTIALVLAEELDAQEEVARRLHHMDSIPHVPKINGLIPTLDAASEDHQRLLDRLYLYGLSENKIQGDGNCQFRALSDQLYRSPEHHKVVRKTIVEQRRPSRLPSVKNSFESWVFNGLLKSEPDAYEAYVPMKYGEYLKKMSKSGEWGDHVTLQAAADHYGVRISLVTSFRDTCFIQISPSQQRSNRVIWLSFWSEVHYNSIYPEGDVPDSVDVKKKRHWLFHF